MPSVIFEELGLRYYGPIDGHDIPLLIRTFEFLKTQNEPVLLHILTKKGKGYEPAIEKPDKFHGLGKFTAETGETAAAATPDLFGDSRQDVRQIRRHQPQDRRHHRRDAERHRPRPFPRQQHPDRYFDVGIAEEHAALFACGLATQGLKPFLTIYSTFMQRAYDMIIHDIALQNLNVALCMDRAGLSGDDGPTHHGLFDIGYLRHVPNIVHMQPKDEDEFVDMLWTMANHNSGPIAIRYPRGAGTGAKPKATPKLLEIGKAEVRAARQGRRDLRPRQHVRDGARKRRENWRRRASPSRSSTRAGSSRSTPARWNFSRAACRSSARSKTTFCTTASAAP